MKARNGFVSNSSSSSFIVIDSSGKKLKPHWDEEMVVDHNFGETQFGWGPEVITDINSRIIFAYLQTIYAKTEYAQKWYEYKCENWLSMLEEVIKKNSEVKNIVWNVDIEGYNAYIDHQSSAICGENTEMFDNEEKLTNFIFGYKSKIVLDNDNH